MSTYFRTVDHEQEEPLATTITGTIPEWLQGSLVRNGPGKYEVGDTAYNHLFDGLAKVHKFDIRDGKVTYQSRFIRSESYTRNMAANRIVVSEFGTIAHPDPCKTWFGRMQSFFKLVPDATDNTNVNVYPVGDQIYAATEINIIYRVDKDTLETMNKIDIEKLVSANMATAHPHIEQDGTIYNLGALHKHGKQAILKFMPSKDGIEKAEIVATIPFRWKMKASYHHSFAMTENFIVLVESPLVMNIMKLLTAKMRGKTAVSAMEWMPQYNTIFHIIDKKTGNIINPTFKYTSKPFFAFHHGNAYESDGSLVIDLCSYAEGGVIGDASREAMQNHEVLKDLPGSYLTRYVLPLDISLAKSGEDLVKGRYGTASASLQENNTIDCQPHLINKEYFEFPRINYKYNGKKYQYVYGFQIKGPTNYKKLYKLDVDSGEMLNWFEEDGFPSEPVFVARPGADAEDDGVLLSVVLHQDLDTEPYLLVLDASNMQELARASVSVGVHADFHGDFFHDK